MDMSSIIKLLGGAALFLFGMLLMGDGLKRVAGNKLEIILYKLSSTPLKGVLLGTGVTAVIQSSSATSVMVVGFVNSGMMKVRQAIGVVLGAILGTSVTGWIICLSSVDGGSSSLVKLLSTATLTGVISVIGIILRMFCKSSVKRTAGTILLGFAILMTGMGAMSEAVSGLRDSQIFTEAITSLKNPFLGILMGCVITCVLQSASASVGILQVLSVTGAITFDIAFPVIMGIAIGAAVPVLFSALGSNISGKRVALVYLIIDIIGVTAVGSVFYCVNVFVDLPFMNSTLDMVGVSLVNTSFRFVVVLILTPFIKHLEKIVTVLVRDKKGEINETAEIDSLREIFITHPGIALERSNSAVCSMAEKAEANLKNAIALFEDYSDEGFEAVDAKEQVIDKYEDRLGTYLVTLNRSELTHKESHQIFKILHTIGDFERIGDHAVNLSKAAREINEKKLVFSEDAIKEINILSSAVIEIVDNTIKAFLHEDIAMARKVEPLEQTIDNLCDDIKTRHIKRVQSGDCSLNHGFVFNDILTNYERVADHCSNVAVAMIELENGIFDTHEYLSSVKTKQTDSFAEDFAMYTRKYSLEEDNKIPF